jgi:histidinol-phosphatase
LHYRSENLVVQTKPDMTPVSDADTEVEQAVRDRLATARPEDSVLGEEFGSSTASSQSRRWIIDPIDGTKSFVRGVPSWATLLALQDGEETMVGVVSAPALGRRWWASRGAGAFVDDQLSPAARQIGVSAIRELGDAQLCLGGFEEWSERGRLDALLELAGSCWRTRGFGDFWSYMLVAEGAVEIGLDPIVSLWDLAAPQVIVEEAGGRFTDLGGVDSADGGDALATNGLLHDSALRIIGR